MIRRRTCLLLFRGALLPCVENTPVRELFIPQALSLPYPLSSLRPCLCAPPFVLRAPPSPLFPPLSLSPRYSSLRPSLPLCSSPAYSGYHPRARIYYGRERGQGGRECALPSVGGVIGRFLLSRNVLCVSRAERAKTLLPRAHLRSR